MQASPKASFFFKNKFSISTDAYLLFFDFTNENLQFVAKENQEKISGSKKWPINFLALCFVENAL